MKEILDRGNCLEERDDDWELACYRSMTPPEAMAMLMVIQAEKALAGIKERGDERATH